jgi:uncharacterized membrane protein YraQ (UPF0718 family)
VFVTKWLVVSVLIGALTTYLVRPSAPQESWAHRLACVVPLALIAGFVLVVPSSA